MSGLLFRFRWLLSVGAAPLALLLLLILPAPSFIHSATNTAVIELRLSAVEEPNSGRQITEPHIARIPAAGKKLSRQPSPPREQGLASKPVASINAPVARPTVAQSTATQASPDAHESAVNAAAAHAAQLTPPAAMPPDFESNAEAAYIAKVRAYLQDSKRYPTGREASLQRPAGTARLWFVLSRSGELIDCGVQRSSGSMLLDNSALSTVRRSTYLPFPGEAWKGRAQQRFVVELNFVPAH